MSRTAYIAGKIAGLPHHDVKVKFDRIASKLKNLGYQVIKPATISDNNPTWEDVMRADIKRLLECDEIHMLPDWQESKGAQLERDIAMRLGMEVVYH